MRAMDDPVGGVGHVSGYSPACVVGAGRPAPHGWAEAHVAGLGWVAFTGLPLRKGCNRTPPGHRAPAIEREAAMDGKVQRMKPGNRI